MQDRLRYREVREAMVSRFPCFQYRDSYEVLPECRDGNSDKLEIKKIYNKGFTVHTLMTEGKHD